VDKTIKAKLRKIERQAGDNSPGIFIIEDGKIISSGREYTPAEYEAIKKSKRVITIIDDLEEVKNGNKEN
jgi:hypothetical protein